MSQPVDVVVVGSGIVGAACARALSRAGMKVRIVEHPAPQWEGWRAAAGMLAAQIESGVEDPMFELALSGRKFYRRESQALLANTGIDIGLEERGILRISRTDASADHAKKKIAWQRQQACRADWITADEVAIQFPGFSPGFGAFWAADDGQVHPQHTRDALFADAKRLGAETAQGVVTSLLRNGERLEGVLCGDTKYHASHVVIANGAWSGLLTNLPRPIAVAPVYGRAVIFKWPSSLAPAIVYGRKCYILPRGDEMIVGATMEHPGFVPIDDAVAVDQLLQRATELLPVLATMAPVRVAAGMRPGTPDGIPIIGPEPRLPGLWYATGHGRNGILMAGITGELLAQSIVGEPLSDALLPATPERFWGWSE